jgi:hypothetical protein
VSESAPIPTSATYNPGTRLVTVNFDKPLTPGVLDGSNWTVVIATTAYPPTGAVTAAGSMVTWTALGFGAPCPPGNVVNYLASPPDLTGLTGDPVAAFAQPYA